jgi:hypothetical protein
MFVEGSRSLRCRLLETSGLPPRVVPGPPNDAGVTAPADAPFDPFALIYQTC